MPETPEPSPKASPASLAFEWVARIFSVSVVMVLPGLGGQWLDKYFQTKFLAIVGLGVGFCAGFAALLVMVKASSKAGNKPSK